VGSYWMDHFFSTDSVALPRFLSLSADDCAPLLASLGLPVVPGITHESAENRVFGFGEVTIKFFRPGRWSLDALGDEANFLEDLVAAGLDVVKPIGRPATWQGMHYQLYETVAPPFDLDPKVLTPAQLRAHVHLVAEMHRVGAQRDAPHRPHLRPLETGAELLAVVRRGGYLPAELDARYADLVGQLCAWLAAEMDGVPTQRVHDDPGTWNVLWRPQGPLLMDLDDFNVGPVAIDLAIMDIPYRLSTLPADMPRAERRPLQRAKVLEFYREVADFPEEWERMFVPLRGMRGLFFDAWFSARWADPGFADCYPDDTLTEPSWWRDNLDRIEQLLAMR